jgi:hypothetical protein
MTCVSYSGRWRAVIGLIAAYAVALQTVFTTLAPMPAIAAGNADALAAHCFGAGNAGLPESGEPGAPSPASGKMHCVFCGACAAGSVILPGEAYVSHLRAERPVARARAAAIDRPVALHARSGPARAPPLTL